MKGLPTAVLLFFVIIGFSVGDELGFKESISNTEINRRRSAQSSSFAAQAALAQKTNQVSTRSAGQPPQKLQSLTANGGGGGTSAAGTVRASITAVDPYAKAKQFSATVPPFKPIPPAAERPAVVLMNGTTATRHAATVARRTVVVPAPAAIGVMSVPSFNAMPASIARIGSVAPPPFGHKMDAGSFALRALPSVGDDLPAPLAITNTNSIQSYLMQSNVTDELLEAALLKRQQYLQRQQTTTTTTTTTTQKPRHTSISNIGKVMNAPREYYPVGYDKNFDDNFASRVDLPDTSFSCGDQKHFPGLYSDVDLNCMVFHVCALTDDGLVMKSFLCPDSTLFDMAVLKCNWWFYVDCKNSPRLYDSNIPISKSYQLMKALTFFSNYRKEAAGGGASSSPSPVNSAAKSGAVRRTDE